MPDDRPVVLLMRHAARPPLVAGESGIELSITSEGEAAAAALGAAFMGELRSLRTSPVRRCVETAEAIARGAGFDGAAIPDRTLGDPGIFVADPAVAWKSWEVRGHDGMLEHFAAGGERLPGFAEPVVAARSLVEHLVRGARRLAGVHLAITHDAIILALLAGIWRRPLSRGEWPGFLEAVALWEEGDEIWLAYRGVSRVLVPAGLIDGRSSWGVRAEIDP